MPDAARGHEEQRAQEAAPALAPAVEAPALPAVTLARTIGNAAFTQHVAEGGGAQRVPSGALPGAEEAESPLRNGIAAAAALRRSARPLLQRKPSAATLFTRNFRYGSKILVGTGEKADNITSALQGPPTAASAVKALAAGQNGAAGLTLPGNSVSEASAKDLERIVQYKLVDMYTQRYVAAHPEVEADDPPEGAAPKKGEAPPAPEHPSGGPSSDDVDKAILDTAALAVQSEIEGKWTDGRWPEGHEYIWGEDDTSTAELIGVTGSLAFAGLRARTLVDSPALGPSAETLGVRLPSIGRLVVRQIVGGRLDRGAHWSASWFDNLAVNVLDPVVASDGTGNSVSMSLKSEWLWDDNMTVWDFIVTVDESGLPRVDDKRSGRPDDSKLFGRGEGGTHGTVVPSKDPGTVIDIDVANTDPKVARVARAVREQRLRTGDARLDRAMGVRAPSAMIARNPLAAGAGALLGKAVAALATDTAASIAGGIQAASAIAQTAQAFAQGTTGVQPLKLPDTPVMSPTDKTKLQLMLAFRVANTYTKMHMERHPGDLPGGTPGTPGPGTPTNAPPTPSGAPTGAPTAGAIDAAVADAARKNVEAGLIASWKTGFGDSKEFIWSEGNDADIDTIGITGAIAFSDLRGRIIEEAPALEGPAADLKIGLESPGMLRVRQIVSGVLARSASFRTSLWDDLAINIPTPVVSSEGPEQSAAVDIDTDWLWDDNMTTWDFKLWIDDAGKPQVLGVQSGTPDDSAFLGDGKGGSHQHIDIPKAKKVPEATPGEPNSGAVR